MATVVAAALPLVGNPAGGEVSVSLPFSDEDIARRRKAARTTAWIIGAVVLAIYVIGFFFKRG